MFGDPRERKIMESVSPRFVSNPLDGNTQCPGPSRVPGKCYSRQTTAGLYYDFYFAVFARN